MKSLISLATRLIPRHHLHKFSHFILLLISPFYYGKRYEDPITNKKYRKMLPYGRVNSRKNALSPHSMALERHRMLWLFLKDRTNLFTDKLKFLHIAPEYCFIKPFSRLSNLEYITADLNSPWAKIKMDAHDIPLENSSVDVIMCNHVLEHVEDDKKVLKEFYRVMRPGGWGIFQVPMDLESDTTLEDPKINTPELREKHYWQSDHLRLYGRDYPERLRKAGFIVDEIDFAGSMAEELVERYALIKEEPVYFCKK